MFDNIPYRAWNPIKEEVILWMENYTQDSEYYVVSEPSYYLADPEEHKNGKFVTLVYCVNPIDPDCILRCLEYVFSDAEEQAEKKHFELLDKWNYIQYTPQSEVTDETVQDWGLSDVFGL